jgi:hypothetical protein
MRPLTDRERRTLRYGGIGLAAYLVLFFGVQAWRHAERRRTQYEGLLREAAALQAKLAVYDEKVEATRKLMEQFRMDPATLSRTSLVARVSTAIQQAAMQGGIQLGPVRETPSRASGRELSAMQIEWAGPVPAVLLFLQSLGSIGFPLVLDSVQFNPAPTGPGQVKVQLGVIILDFQEWKPREGRPDA